MNQKHSEKTRRGTRDNASRSCAIGKNEIAAPGSQTLPPSLVKQKSSRVGTFQLGWLPHVPAVNFCRTYQSPKISLILSAS